MARNSDDTAIVATGGDFASRFFVPPAPPMDVRYGGATHPGKVRDNNEDHFAIIHRCRSQHFLSTNLSRENLPAFRDEAYGFIVADGLGGEAAGEMASRLVMEESWELSAQASSWIMKFSGLPDQQVRKRINAYAARMHEKLKETARENPKLEGMGTTWTSIYVIGWDAIVTQIGDSRAYLFRGKTLERLTRDHTLTQELLDRGVPPEMTTNFRNVVTRTLGSEQDEVIPDVDHLVLQDGDQLLLCTDGLTDCVSEEEIVKILEARTTPDETCDALIAKALDGGGKDNVTVVLATFHEVK